MFPGLLRQMLHFVLHFICLCLVPPCEKYNGGCGQLCENDLELRAASCSCIEGYEISTDKVSCIKSNFNFYYLVTLSIPNLVGFAKNCIFISAFVCLEK